VLEAGALLDLDAVGNVLGVSRSTVLRMIDRHELPVVRLGGSAGRPVRVSASALNEKLQGWTER